MYFILPQRMETHSRYPPSHPLPQQHFSSTYPPASSWNGFEIRSLLLLNSHRSISQARIQPCLDGMDLKSGHPSFIQGFMSTLYPLSLTHTLNTSFLFSFMQGFMQGFMPALSPQAFAYFLEKPLCLCCLWCWRNSADVRFF